MNAVGSITARATADLMAVDPYHTYHANRPKPRTGLAHAVAMEAAKTRGRGFWWMFGGITAICLLHFMFLLAASPVTSSLPGVMFGWDATAEAMIFLPLMAIVLASRLATIDDEERMGQQWRMFGQSDVRRFVAKTVVVGCCCAMLGLALQAIAVVRMLNAHSADVDAYRAIVPPLAVSVIVASLTAAGVQCAVSMLANRQALAFGVGLIGMFIGYSSPYMNLWNLGFLAPWGLTAAASPFRDLNAGVIHVAASPWTNAVAGVGVMAVWLLICLFAVRRHQRRR